ncbi:MAG: response regulator [Sediminibacterium sp.]
MDYQDSSCERKVFLIVDDDPDDCLFFIDAVKDIDLSFQCRIAINGEDALHKLRQEMKLLPDIIFLDLNMPRMNGMLCLTELKKDKYLKHIPVVIFTTSSNPKDINETHLLGAVYFITKPHDFEKLRNEITSAIEIAFSII